MDKPKDALDKAIDALANTNVPPGPPPELTDATVSKLAETTRSSQQETGTIKITNIIRRISSPIKIAAAILILIATGYAIGRLTAYKAPDIEQLQAALEPAIRQNLLQEMGQYMQVSLANGYAQLKDELQQQYRRDLSDFAIQTLAASSTVTNQRLQELIDAINAAQTNDRQWFTSALSQIEYNRLQDKTQLSAGLKTLALQTEDQLQRTRQDMVQLLSYPKPDSIDVDKSNNQNNLNERSE
jgi:uncharacterized membrane-anchored protein YhcB (DUF1043 family)